MSYQLGMVTVVAVLALIAAIAGCQKASAPTETGPAGTQTSDLPEAEPVTADEGASEGGAGASDEIEWITDFDEGMALAKKLDKPVMMDIYAEWCGPCRDLDKKTWPEPMVIELSKKFVCIKINSDENPDVGEKFQVSAIPFIAFLTSDGEIIDTSMGFKGPDEMFEAMQLALM